MNLAVGFFDGVHLGHRRILAQADAALTFLNHPATVFAPDRVPPLLMPTPARLAAIGAAHGELKGKEFYVPGELGYEAKIREHMLKIKKQK